ncbi:MULTISPECIES: hypothetical protein [unclassified Acinetobacter]|nr:MULTISPECIES: hypothetical protein [unclassified Acinetobacter]MDH0031370.1 hypothetical protein [Acinetobacter sp. GD04021]MDH0887145.1 hypothetical protein [Acinetobacter sp. GD03873]MDH1083566.1 hypothetical protein [Acinetobacter sp. GD03983]MDH2190461.1 hypothetical protein [Acinetobacter sp. GD03645]MDH2204093.1 hypothetical protein [Acinetobacter sp. GD03647]
MKYRYSSTTRVLTVLGNHMTYIFRNVGLSDIENLVTDTKFKEACWRQ